MQSSLANGLAVSVRGIGLDYGTSQILRGIDVDLPQGKTLALLGSSGCGKTTLLRLLAGLLPPTRGSVEIAGRKMADASTGLFVPPEKRGLGMVFQDYALWPHMSVEANVAFPLEMAGVNRADIRRRVDAALSRVELGQYASRTPAELSGGQQQRVAIARAIVGEPQLVLFDEPLSNLDRDLRETLVGDLAELLASLSLSAVYVTHDHNEAFTIADQVAVMRGGQIIQLAEPQTLVDAPALPEVAEFLKLGAVVTVCRHEHGWALQGTDLIVAPASEGPQAAAARVMLARRALSVSESGIGGLGGRVLRSRFQSDGHLLSIALGDGPEPVTVEAWSGRRHSIGSTVGVAVDTTGLRWFPTR